MKFHIPIRISLILLLAAWITPALAQSHVFGKRKTSVLPEQFLRAYDPITVFFSKERGPQGGGHLDQPDGVISIEPAHPGEYRWLDSKTLQFLPTIPWPALERFQVKVQGKTHRLATLMAAPQYTQPRAGTRDLPPISQLSLTFAHPIETQQLAKMITMEVKPTPGLANQPGRILTARDFSLKTIERRSLDQPVEYMVLLENPVPFGHVLRLNLRLSLDDRNEEAFLSYAYTTKPLFRVTGLGTQSSVFPVADQGSVYSREQAIKGGSGKGRFEVRFSDIPASISLEDVKALVRFQPAVRDLTHHLAGRNLILNFTPERDLTYRVSLHHRTLRDRAGRVLAPFGPTEAWVYYAKAPAYISWRQSQGILERYGPQQFPMEGRDRTRLDVRVYKIDPLERNFWPFPQNVLVLDEEQRPAGPGEEPSPQTNMPEFIRQLGTPLVSRIIRTQLKADGQRKNFGLNVRELLADVSGKDQAGTYLVGYRELGSSRNRHYVRLQVTDLSLAVVEEQSGITFAVTSLKTGQPVSAARVVVEKLYQSNVEAIINGTTDAEGLFRYNHEDFHRGEVFRIHVSKGEDRLVLDPLYPPPTFFDNHFSRNRRWLSWLSTSPNRDKNLARMYAHIYPERPVYKPDDVVHLRGYLRQRKNGKLSSGVRQDCKLIIEGPGAKQWTYEVTFDEHGNFGFDFDEKDLPTGTFMAMIEVPRHGRLGYVTFKKEAYRIPRFEVNINGPKKAPLDAPFSLTLSADYYAGGRVVDQDVSWRITTLPYRWTAPQWPEFLFSSDERFSSNRGEAYVDGGTRTDRTDDNGSATLSLDPTLSRDARPRRYVVEATVTGADQQSVSTTHTTLALPPFVVGLKMPRLLKDAQALEPQIVVLDMNGEALPDQVVNVRVSHRQWHSYLVESDFTTGKAKYVTDVVDTPIFEETLTSGEAPLTRNYPVEEAGVYIVEVLVRDALGRLQKVKADLFAAGDEPVVWQKPKEQIFEAVWDKERYEPGETATLIIKSPFQKGRALTVVEHPSRNTYQWVDIKGGKGLLEVLVTGEMTPKIPVHVLLLRGRTTNTPDARLDLGKPVSRAATAWLNVRPKNNELVVKVSHEQQVLPGSQLQVEVDVTNPDGDPLSGEVTLWLVDRAVLALGQEAELDPLKTFIQAHPAYLRLSDTRNEVVGELPTEPFPGGDGARPGEGLFGEVTVRKNFKTVPFYKAGIPVTNGKATVTIDMPDNLTDFAVRAVATSGPTRFGHTRSKVSVRLPLIIQSALPRFVRPGDSFVAGGIGRVVEGEGGAGSAAIQVEGVTLEGDTTRSLNWEPNKPQQVYYPMEVTTQAALPGKDPATVSISLAVKREADGASDAFLIKLPVRSDRDWEYRDAFNSTDQEIALLAPDEAPRAGTLSRELLLTTEPAAIKMLAALEYNGQYPYGCTEQRISRAMPYLAMVDLMDDLGLENKQPQLERGINETLEYLQLTKKSSGLFGYWPGSGRGYVNLTAYVLEFMVRARDAGYTIDETMLQRTITTLRDALRSDYGSFIGGHSFTERALALRALSLAGAFDEAYAFELGARGQMMSLATEATILHTLLKEGVDDQSMLDRLSDDLQKSVIFALRNGLEKYQGLQYRARSWGGLIHASETKTLARITQALYRKWPQDPKVAILKDELVNLGTGKGWGGTSANVAAIQALSEILGNQLPENQHRLDLKLGSQRQTLDTQGKTMLRYSLEGSQSGTLTYRDGSGDTPPLLWQRMRFLPAGRGDAVPALNEGFVVGRELEHFIEGESNPAKIEITSGTEITFPIGAIVEEHVRVINPEDRTFVAISVPFAAGLEPMNPNLATAPAEATPRGSLTLEPTYAQYQDDQVIFFYDELPKGTFHFYFRLRASIEGNYSHPPARAEMMYEQTTFGRGAGARILVQKAEGVQ